MENQKIINFNEDEQIKQSRERLSEHTTNRILAIAAMKSLLNDASGEIELLYKAAQRFTLAYDMEKYYSEAIIKRQNEIYEEAQKSEGGENGGQA